MKNELLMLRHQLQHITENYAQELTDIKNRLSALWEKVDHQESSHFQEADKSQIFSVKKLDVIADILTAEINEYCSDIESRNKIILKLFEAMSVCLDEYPYQLCDFCKKYCDPHIINDAPIQYKGKHICDSCFDDNFFICRNCGKTFPISEYGEEANDYGYYCANCVKPLGFPETLIIAPDFPYCENEAFSDLNSLNEYLTLCGNRAAESGDTIKLIFEEKTSKYSAKYKSQKGVAYEIGELNYKGRGSMREIEN